MWPTIFEFSWDTGHMIFFGVFYAVLIVIATSVSYAVARSIVDMFSAQDQPGEDLWKPTDLTGRPCRQIENMHDAGGDAR